MRKILCTLVIVVCFFIGAGWNSSKSNVVLTNGEGCGGCFLDDDSVHIYYWDLEFQIDENGPTTTHKWWFVWHTDAESPSHNDHKVEWDENERSGEFLSLDPSTCNWEEIDADSGGEEEHNIKLDLEIFREDTTLGLAPVWVSEGTDSEERPEPTFCITGIGENTEVWAIKHVKEGVPDTYEIEIQRVACSQVQVGKDYWVGASDDGDDVCRLFYFSEATQDWELLTTKSGSTDFPFDFRIWLKADTKDAGTEEPEVDGWKKLATPIGGDDETWIGKASASGDCYDASEDELTSEWEVIQGDRPTPTSATPKPMANTDLGPVPTRTKPQSVLAK